MIESTYRWGEAFQVRLLALLLQYPDTCHALIEPSYFTNPVCARIAEVLKTIYAKSHEHQAERATLLALLRPTVKDGDWPVYREYLARIYQLVLGDREVLVGQAREFFKEQKFREALVRAERDVSARRYEAAIQKFVALRSVDKTELDLGLDYWEGIRDPQRYASDRVDLVPTGLHKLDRMMGGGLGAGELGIILAGGKVGKSLLLANLSVAALRYSRTVAIATGEMSASRYQKRIDSIITGIPTERLHKLKSSAQEKLEFARRLLKGGLYIKQLPTGKGSTADIENWLDDLENVLGREIGLLVVDYILTFRPRWESKERRINVGQVATELRGIATERGIPVWTASQARRAALSKARLQPEDFAEDISLFWTLDFMVALCQTEDERQQQPELARIYLAEARDVQAGGVVNVTIDRDAKRIFERPE